MVDRKGIVLGAIVATLPAMGCAPDAPDGEDSEFRPYAPPGEFWEWGIGFVEANSTMNIYAGETDTSIGCLSYPIGGDLPTVVQQLQPDGSFGPGLEVFDNVIYRADGTPTCFATQDEYDPALFHLAGPDGTLYSLWGTFIFDGYVSDIPQVGSPDYMALLADDLAYSFSGSQIFEGGYWQNQILATADVDDVAFANPMRKLLFAALVGARCGAVGLAEETPPPVP